MKKSVKKALKVASISLASVIAVLLLVIAVAVYFVFTPQKITPVVLNVVNSNLRAHLDMESVELTFFSTFPRFGLKLTDGTLVSKAVRDSAWHRTDTLVTFKKAVVAVNPFDYFAKNKINIYRLALDSANLYAFKGKDGVANWDIMLPDTAAVDTAATDSLPLFDELAVRRIVLRHATVTFDDRDTRVFANVWDANLRMTANLKKEHSMVALDFKNKNILFWQDGQLLLNHMATHLKTKIELDRDSGLLSLKDALIDVNGVQLDMSGTLQRDTLAHALDVDIAYGLHAPSLETVLKMIPRSVLKDNKVSAQGEVAVNGTLKGLYGKGKMPVITLNVQVKDAAAQYAGMPYGIDTLEADFSGQVDLMRQLPSYFDLRIFHFKGAHTDILADARVEDLLGDPNITFNTQSKVDLTALAKTFPLQEGILLEGKLDANIKLRCRLSSIKKKDFGRIKIGGKIDMEQIAIRDTIRHFDFQSNASLAFIGNDWLAARVVVENASLNAPRLVAAIDNLTASVKTTNPQDTTRIAHVAFKIDARRLKGAMGDSLRLFCAKTDATVKLHPSKRNPQKPQVDLSIKADSIFSRIGDMKMGMDKAGIAVSATQLRDSIWIPEGIVGFNRLTLRTPQCALPIRVKKTSVTVGNRTIKLRNATMRVGRSDITASGAIYDLYGAMRFHKTLRAELSLSSRNLNCNQLIRSLSFPTDSVSAENDTTSTDLSLFVVPRNIDFELKTDFNRVRYGKLVFNKIHGAVDVRNQTIHLKELSMNTLGATMRTTVVYQAKKKSEGYAGFDFRLHDVNIAKLVNFVPSLDSIMPMLRSFQGMVDFNISAETQLDSTLRIKIPSLRSAIHIEGDSLVLLDGETFAEISKKFLFKNKERNLIDSIAVNVSVKDGNVTVYPFVVEMDRYRAAVGGTQDLNMNFNYHISILKSPIPFKLGLNISGNLDKMKFGLGKAKYKDAVTPVEMHRVDSTIVDMGRQIVRDFRKIITPQNRRRVTEEVGAFPVPNPDTALVSSQAIVPLVDDSATSAFIEEIFSVDSHSSSKRVSR